MDKRASNRLETLTTGGRGSDSMGSGDRQENPGQVGDSDNWREGQRLYGVRGSTRELQAACKAWQLGRETLEKFDKFGAF